jgi:hypothetical protein
MTKTITSPAVAQRLKQRSDNAPDKWKRLEVGLSDFHRQRLYGFSRVAGGGGGPRRGRYVRLGSRQFNAEVSQHICRPAEDSRAGDDLRKRTNFGFEVAPVLRKVLRKRRNLLDHNRDEPQDDQETDQRRYGNGGDPANLQTAKCAHDRRQQKAEKNRQRDRNDDVAGEIEDRDDQTRRQERQYTGKPRWIFAKHTIVGEFSGHVHRLEAARRTSITDRAPASVSPTVVGSKCPDTGDRLRCQRAALVDGPGVVHEPSA